MARTPNITRKRVWFVSCGVCLLLVGTFALTVRTNSQQLQVLNQQAKNDLLGQIEASVDRRLGVVGNDDSPFRIVEAKVKEVSGPQFTKLTGKTTDLVTVSSVPEVELVNDSGKTITGFVLALRDPQSQTTRTLVQRKVSVAPGETYTVKREHFVGHEKVTVASGGGQARQATVKPGMDSEKHWIQFAARSDVFITVGMVSFDDGSIWKIKEGGEVR